MKLATDFKRSDREAVDAELAKRYPVPSSVRDYVFGLLTDDEKSAIMKEAGIKYTLEPVDLTALYEYAPGLTSHMINSRINMHWAESFKQGIFSSSPGLKNAGGILLILVGIGVCAWLIMNGSAGDMATAIQDTVTRVGV